MPFLSVQRQEVTSLGDCTNLLHIQMIIPSSLLFPFALIRDQGFTAESHLYGLLTLWNHIKAVYCLYKTSPYYCFL